MLICVATNVKASYKFKNSIAFWGNVINENGSTEITSYKFHAYALMDNGRFQEAVNELLPIAQGLNFGYSEVNYALGSAFMLNKDYANAAKIFEIIVQTRQMLIPQVYANIILAMHFSNNEEKANYYFNEFMKTTNLDNTAANAYINNFNNFINTQREIDLSRPKTV